jgi:hypothetical protein
VDYSKLYDQERKRTKELDSRLEHIYGRIMDAASKLRSGKLGQALSKEYGPENAQQAVLALINECELSLKERQRLDGLVREYIKRVNDLEIERDNEVNHRVMDVSRLESEKQQLTVGHEKQMTRVQTERQNERVRMDAIILQKEREFDSNIDKMSRGFQSKIGQMEMDFENERARLLSDHADQQARLKRDIEALNGALVKREHFKPLSDNDLKSLFSDLAIDIDHVARLRWKYNQTDWTDELLDQVAKNPRRVKKNILQESLWSVLYDNIFCSPFRVLGEEGRSLETEWNIAFGRGRYSSLLY